MSDLNYAASRLSAVKPSASMAVSHLASELKSKGQDVIDLGVGEPDFDTPAHIIEAAHAAALEGRTRYTPTGGAVDLKQAVVDKLHRENSLTYSVDEVIVSNGAKQVIFNALMATLEAGESVVLCAPFFDIYKTMTSVLGGVVKTVACRPEDDFRLTPEALENAIDDTTRWLFLNAPSNPAGAAYNSDQLRALGEVLERHPRVLIMSDEIYEHIIFDERKFVSFAHGCPELTDRILTVNGVSKSFAMTGWRIGYGAGPAALITAMTKVQSQISSGSCSIAQAAAVAALNGPMQSVVEFRQAFEKRRDIVVEHISKVPGLTLQTPAGAFYAFIGCETYIGSRTPDGAEIKNDVDFANYLLSDGLVAAVPGSAYGLSPYFRFSTATSSEQLNKAMLRIGPCVSKLST